MLEKLRIVRNVRELQKLRKKLKGCKDRDELINAFADFYKIPAEDRKKMKDVIIGELRKQGLGGKVIDGKKFKKKVSV